VDCRIAKGRIEEFICDALISLQYQDGPKIEGPVGKAVKLAYADGHFAGAYGEIFQIFPLADCASQRLILVGLGKRENSSPELIRKMAGSAIKSVQNLKHLAFAPVGNPKETLRPIIDGAILGNYRFDKLKSDKKKINLDVVSFFTGKAEIKQAQITGAQVIDEATCFARDLANMPANLLNPTTMAEEAKKIGEKYKISVKVHSEDEIRKLKMGSLLGVAQGSTNRPKLVVWEYHGTRASRPPIVFVGKGVTFDSGGISIKPSDGMEAMKGDMGGAGAVISLMEVVGQLKPKINVVGITPLVENMPSGTAYRPGDVLTASNGKTIEVISTDAEGRLILADALVYAGQFKPQYVVDIATLTGACIVALGLNICGGIMGKDQRLINMLIKAGQESGERLWQLPLWDDYKDLIKSPAADMKNTGGRWGGAITAASFLSEFAEGYPWAHLDIAGMDHEDGDHAYRFKGGTGFGVRLLSQFILDQVWK
jgi:leucyl aminopeptidase